MESAHLLLFFLFIFSHLFFLALPKRKSPVPKKERNKEYPSPRYGTVVEEKRRNASFLGSSCDDVRVMLQLGQAKPPLLRFCFLSSRGGKVKGARSMGVSVKRIYMH